MRVISPTGHGEEDVAADLDAPLPPIAGRQFDFWGNEVRPPEDPPPDDRPAHDLLRRSEALGHAVADEVTARVRAMIDALPASRPASATGPVPDPRRLWLRPAEVAAAYGVSRKTVYGWIHEHRVRVKKLGRKRGAPVLVSRPDVERLPAAPPGRRPKKPGA